MSLGGVESEEEFLISKGYLDGWLHHHWQQGGAHKANTEVLQEWLEKNVMPHQARWFFPARRGKLTFNIKTTSPLESMNRVLKSKQGIKVTPNMPLDRSLVTQDKQTDARMTKNHRKCATRAKSRSCSKRSHTANHVTSPCEGELDKVRAQKGCYAARIVIGKTGKVIEMKRLPELLEYCEDCEASVDRCTTHSHSSPIVTFRRVRRLIITYLGNGWYHVICSCLYRPVMGVACRHIGALLDALLPHHCLIRHHTRFQPFHGRRGCKHITAQFDERKGDTRLLITHDEYIEVMENAEKLERKWLNKLPVCFWEDVGPVVNASSLFVEPAQPLDEMNPLSEFGNGMMSQDVCLSQNDADVGTDELSAVLQGVTIQSDDLFDTLKSHYTQMADLQRLSGDAELDRIFRDAAAKALAVGRAHLHKKLGDDDRNYGGAIVSSHSAVDTNTSFRRLKSRGEPGRGPRKDRERTIVGLTEQSFTR